MSEPIDWEAKSRELRQRFGWRVLSNDDACKVLGFTADPEEAKFWTLLTPDDKIIGDDESFDMLESQEYAETVMDMFAPRYHESVDAILADMPDDWFPDIEKRKNEGNVYWWAQIFNGLYYSKISDSAAHSLLLACLAVPIEADKTFEERNPGFKLGKAVEYPLTLPEAGKE